LDDFEFDFAELVCAIVVLQSARHEKPTTHVPPPADTTLGDGHRIVIGELVKRSFEPNDFPLLDSQRALPANLDLTIANVQRVELSTNCVAKRFGIEEPLDRDQSRAQRRAWRNRKNAWHSHDEPTPAQIKCFSCQRQKLSDPVGRSTDHQSAALVKFHLTPADLLSRNWCQREPIATMCLWNQTRHRATKRVTVIDWKE
jgi:hypothetical protein